MDSVLKVLVFLIVIGVALWAISFMIGFFSLIIGLIIIGAKKLFGVKDDNGRS